MGFKSQGLSILPSALEALTEDENFYQYYATPLKSASNIKREHLNQIKEFLKFSEIQTYCQKAEEIIYDRIKSRLSSVEYSTIENEIKKSIEHFINALESLDGEKGEKPLLLQDLLGLSDETLLHIYDEAVLLIGEEKYENALALLIFLTTLAPYVSSYWIAEGLTLQHLNRSIEAIDAFKTALSLKNSDLAPLFYLISNYLAINEREKAKETFKLFIDVLEKSDEENKSYWKVRKDELRSIL